MKGKSVLGKAAFTEGGLFCRTRQVRMANATGMPGDTRKHPIILEIVRPSGNVSPTLI